MEFTISKDFHDVRLDKFLRKTYEHIPLVGIFRMIRKGNVKVNKKKRKQNYRLQEGDFVRVWEPTPPTKAKSLLQLSKKQKGTIKDSIVYEDENIILCDKPPGMVMHLGSNHEHGLTELVQAYTQNPKLSFVHRIDKLTSGLVMGAKNPATARKLSTLIKKQQIEKYYVILVEGVMENGNDHFFINSFLKKESDRVVEHPNEKNGAKKACSEFTILKRGTKRTLLQARLHTGRTHQLRVQLANIDHPIVGDKKYGRKNTDLKMHLFSRQIVIPQLNLDFFLPIPRYFGV